MSHSVVKAVNTPRSLSAQNIHVHLNAIVNLSHNCNVVSMLISLCIYEEAPFCNRRPPMRREHLVVNPAIERAGFNLEVVKPQEMLVPIRPSGNFTGTSAQRLS